MVERPETVSAVLLAAGSASRMGKPKQLLPFGESTLVERAVDTLLASAVAEVIVVVGCRADEVAARISDRPVRVVTNPDYAAGMSTSIIAGLEVVSPHTTAILLALGDQPYLTSATIDRLISGFRSSGRGIVLPSCQGQRGNPVIFARRYLADLMKLTGDIGGREIIRNHPDDVFEVEVANTGVLQDIDTPTDYRNIPGEKTA